MPFLEAFYRIVQIFIRERVLIFALAAFLGAIGAAFGREYGRDLSSFEKNRRDAISNLISSRLETSIGGEGAPVMLAAAFDVYSARSHAIHEHPETGLENCTEESCSPRHSTGGEAATADCNSPGQRAKHRETPCCAGEGRNAVDCDGPRVCDTEHPSDACKANDALHAAARELPGLLRLPSADTCRSQIDPEEDVRGQLNNVQEAVSRHAEWTRTWTGWEQWRAKLLEFAQGKGTAQLEFTDCSPSFEATPLGWRDHEAEFGRAVCDEDPTGRIDAKLVIPARLRLDAAMFGRAQPAFTPPSLLQPSALTNADLNATPATAGPNATQEAERSPRPPAGAAPQLTCRVKWASSLSRALDLLLEPLRSRDERLGSPSTGRLVQVYFIGMDGMLRLWQHDSRESPRTQFGPVRRWGDGSSYFHTLIEGGMESTHLSNPYIDLGTNGFVSTRCTSLRVASAVPNERALTVGAICTDLSIPFPADDGDVTRTRPYRVLVAKVAYRNNKLERVTFEKNPGPRKFLEGTPHNEDALERALTNLPSDTNPSPAFSSIGPIWLGAERFYYVPIAKETSGQERTFSLLLVRPEPASMPLGTLGWSLGFGAIATVMTIWCVAKTRAQTKQRLETAVLQNLQVGVIATRQINGIDRIEAANDRAEELLGVPIPSFGARDAGLSVTTSELFQEHAFAESDPENASSAADVAFEPLHLDEILSMRRRGVGSVYYVKTVQRGRGRNIWLKVEGAPFSGASEENPLRTFAVLNRVNAVISKKLDSQHSTNAERRPNHG